MKLQLGIILALALATPALAQDKAADRAARFTTAVSQLKAHANSDALKTLDPLLADYEKDYTAEKRKIYCGHNQTQTTAYMLLAAQEKKSAVAIDPGWCDALWAKGYVLVDMERHAEALPYLERAVAMAPHHSHYLSELGYAYQALKDWRKSYDFYDRAAKSAEMSSNPDFQRGRAWRGMGFSLIELGRWDEAEAMFRKCVELDPNDAKAKAELDFIAQNRPKRS